MRNKLVAPLAALLVLGLALAAVLHASLTRLPELDAGTSSSPPPLALEAVVWTPRANVGQPLPVEFRLRNLTERPLWVLPLPDPSDRGRGYPRGVLEIRDAAGALQDAPRETRDRRLRPLTDAEFRRLDPGQCSEPLRHPLIDWRPRRPGVYTLRFSYDSTPRPPRGCEPVEPRREETLRRLAEMPRVLLRAQATVEVIE